MRCLNRNKKPFYYALYKCKTPIIDDYGNESGQYEVSYFPPESCNGNVSPARGETSSMQFGANEGYDKVIVLEDPNTPIDEYTVLWIDTVPSVNEDGELLRGVDGAYLSPWDYIVKKVARSINSVSIAVSKVDVDG